MWESAQKTGPTNAWKKPLNTAGSIPTGPKSFQQTQTQQRGNAPVAGPKNAPQGQQVEQSWPQGAPRGPRRMISSVICWLCGKAGHVRAVCRTPARERARDIKWVGEQVPRKRGYTYGNMPANQTGANWKRPGMTGPAGKPVYTQDGRNGYGVGPAPAW